MAGPPVNAASVERHLDGGESIEALLVSQSGPVERQIDGSVSTLSPAGDLGSVLAVTTARVVFVVGGGDRGGEDSVITIPYPAVADVSVSDGLLQSEIAVETTDGETYTLSPDEGDIAAAAAFVTRLADRCERVQNLVEKAELRGRDVDLDPDLPVSEIESGTTEGSLARAYATLTDVDVSAIEGLPSLRDRIERRWLHNYVERGSALEERAERALQDGRDDEAVARFQAAVESFDEALAIAEDHGFASTPEICEQRDAIAENAVDAFREAADAHVEAAESAPEHSDRALAAYERARDDLEVARSVAESVGVDVDDLSTALARVEEEITFAEWEWGGED